MTSKSLARDVMVHIPRSLNHKAPPAKDTSSLELDRPTSPMASFREHHRVIIASLFLPKTAALYNNEEQPKGYADMTHISEEIVGAAPLISAVPATPGAKTANIPFLGIVEDLKSKTSTPGATTPYSEPQKNPIAAHFQSLGGALTALKARGEGSFHLSQPPAGHTVPTTPSSTKPQSPSRRKNLHQNDAPARHSSTRRSNSVRRAKSHSPSPSPQWHFEPNPQGNGGLYNAVASVSGAFLRRKLWVGTLGTATDGFEDGVRRAVDRRLREECESVPIWFDDNEFSGFYDTFCHQVLWPCLHYAIPDAPKVKVFYESSTFKQYVACNQKFADAIIANYKAGDIIWVNDYHLMLVPSMVRAALPGATIGFFMHVAFPSSEIFRCLAVREQLLNGILAADLIGFQTANFARHFRQTVSRILSLEAVPKGITTKEGKFVDVGVFPMGIDVKTLDAKRKEEDVKEWVRLLRQRYQGMRLLVGRDKLDEVQGVRKKLEAFEVFLQRWPEMVGRVVLLQVALSTTEENETQVGVADVVARLNAKWSSLTYQPVVFLHTQDLTFSQYLALLTVADAFIVTSLREGMALRTHEFVECQEKRHRPLILSEFTGSYSYAGFRSCIAINPWDARNTAEAIWQALTMDDDEAKMRWRDLHSHVTTQTAQKFVTTFLTRCVRVNLEHQQRDPKSIPLLDMNSVLPKYKYSSERLLLLDLEDTLWVREHPQHAFEPPEQAVEILRKLGEDKRNQVWLLSNLPRAALDKVTKLLPDIGLVAENGCFIKPRPSRGKQQEWINMVANYNMTWKTPCLEILAYFTERTPGSFVVPREASIVWHFWTHENMSSGDRAWAKRQAAEAQNHIWDSLGERYGLRIIPGPNSFIVLPSNVSRSSAVGAILRPSGPTASPHPTDEDGGADLENVDLLLCMGSDEKLLTRLNELHNAETVTTSGKGSDAKWRLEVPEIIPTLWRLANGR